MVNTPTRLEKNPQTHSIPNLVEGTTLAEGEVYNTIERPFIRYRTVFEDTYHHNTRHLLPKTWFLLYTRPAENWDDGTFVVEEEIATIEDYILTKRGLPDDFTDTPTYYGYNYFWTGYLPTWESYESTEDGCFKISLEIKDATKTFFDICELSLSEELSQFIVGVRFERKLKTYGRIEVWTVKSYVCPDSNETFTMSNEEFKKIFAKLSTYSTTQPLNFVEHAAAQKQEQHKLDHPKQAKKFHNDSKPCNDSKSYNSTLHESNVPQSLNWNRSNPARPSFGSNGARFDRSNGSQSRSSPPSSQSQNTIPNDPKSLDRWAVPPKRNLVQYPIEMIRQEGVPIQSRPQSSKSKFNKPTGNSSSHLKYEPKTTSQFKSKR